jgi:hypothetical protein
VIKFIFIFLPILLSIDCHAQTNSIDQYAKYIDSLLSKKILKVKEYHQMSYCGGSLKGYYLNNKLVYINTIYGGELDVIDTKWYVKNNSLVKSVEKYSDKVEPEDCDAFRKTNKDKSGKCHYNSPKPSSTITTISYGDKIILNRTSNNQVAKVGEAEKVVEIERTKECFNILIKELNE